MAVHEPLGLNRVARLQGRSVPRVVKTVDRPRDQWLEIAVPAIVTAEIWVQRPSARHRDGPEAAQPGEEGR